MPVVACPRCGGKLEVPFIQLQQWTECPACRLQFTPLAETVAPPSAVDAPPRALPAEESLAAPPSGRKLVVAVEGPDGSGKSSLIRFIKEFAQQHGQAFTWIGRRGSYARPEVARLSTFLKEEARVLTPQADFLIRIARDFQRAQVAAQAATGLVVLDRFVLTVLSLIRGAGQDPEPLMGFLKEVAHRAGLQATLFVRCPFEVALSRVNLRNEGHGKREMRTESFLRKLAGFMEEDFQRGILTGQQWPVDNTQTLATAEQEVASYLRPYLGLSGGGAAF
jgi:thymidylate kinase